MRAASRRSVSLSGGGAATVGATGPHPEPVYGAVELYMRRMRYMRTACACGMLHYFEYIASVLWRLWSPCQSGEMGCWGVGLVFRKLGQLVGQDIAARFGTSLAVMVCWAVNYWKIRFTLMCRYQALSWDELMGNVHAAHFTTLACQVPLPFVENTWYNRHHIIASLGVTLGHAGTCRSNDTCAA